MNPTAERLLTAASHGDVRAGTAAVMSQIDAGMPLKEVVEDVTAPVQREVGDRWLRNEWKVADEHRATAVVDAALAAAAFSAHLPPPGLGRMLCVCAEGEWHTLAARMAAAVLSAEGWGVVFLGGSIPASQLEEALRAERPDVVGIHVSLPMHLPGAMRTIDAARSVGVEVVVGGRAVDESPQRASAVGATHIWGGDGLVEVDAAFTRDDDLAREAALLVAQEDDVVDAAYAHLAAEHGVTGELSVAHRQRTVEDLRYMLRHLTAAGIVGDTTIWSEFYAWLLDVLASRGVPAVAAERGVDALAEVVRTSTPRIATVLA